MQIAIDIGHPAHVHYFKHFIGNMQKKGHTFLITARQRGEIFNLLESLGLPYTCRGAGSNSTIGKIINLPLIDWAILCAALRFQPDLFLSFGSMYAAHVAKLLRRPHIVFDDTEFSKKEYYLYAPFSNVILTPYCFRRDLGYKHQRFDGIMELCYLHPRRFQPDLNVLRTLKVAPGEKYAVFRFVAFKAIHDIGIHGFSMEKKIAAVKHISRYAKVFISSEYTLPEALRPYRIPTAPDKLHDAISYASLYLGDSQTTTTEAACLGTPAVRCNAFAETSLERANFIELARAGLLFNYNVCRIDEAIDKACELLTAYGTKELWQRRRDRFVKRFMDVTSFMQWMVECYPHSVQILKKTPDIQEEFK